MTGLGRVEYGPGRRRAWLYVALSAVMTAISVLNATTGDHPVIGWVCTALFGLLVAVFLRRALRSGPLLVLDESGFDDRTTMLAQGRVAWTDVTSIDVRRVGLSTVMISVGIDGSRPVAVGASMLEASPEDVASAMAHRWQAATA